MQIWIYLNGIQQGPYSFDQLRQLPLEPTTPVWYNGLAEWTPAAQAPATAALFTTDAPQTERPASQQTQTPGHISTIPEGKKPPTFLVWNILLTVLCCAPTALAGIITGVISSSRWAAGNTEGAKRMSVVTEWLLIISIVWMLVALPLSIVSNLLT